MFTGIYWEEKIWEANVDWECEACALVVLGDHVPPGRELSKWTPELESLGR